MSGVSKAFIGGMRIRDQREPLASKPIRNAALPRTTIVPFLQHSGEPARGIVRVGMHVEENACIAEPLGETGANVHSPIPGQVREIRTITLPDGRVCEAAVIDLEGTFSSTGKAEKRSEWRSMRPEALLEKIRKGGVVGLGGSGTPTHSKLIKSREKGIKTLLINCIENEPFRSADERVLIESTASVVEGARILRVLFPSSEILFAVSERSKNILKALTRELAQDPRSIEGVKVHVFPDRYPLGDERIIFRMLHGVSIPETVNPVSMGFLSMNVATVLSIHDAIVCDLPQISRVITVCGDAIVHPRNIRVRFGTPLSWVLEECGGLKTIPDRIVMGGLMTGQSISDIDTPITKLTSMIAVISSDEVSYAPMRDCIRCGLCVRHCPRGLEPIRLVQLIQADRVAQAEHEGLSECSHCGICAYACPSRIPLTEILASAQNAHKNGE